MNPTRPILVTGGAGYIGSHMVKALLERGQSVVVVDNLFRGHRAAVPATAEFHQLDLRETDRLVELMTSRRIAYVLHFAALAYVGESVTQPAKYYDNNTAGSLSLLAAIDQANVSRLVFSSTCATYGEPTTVPITEDMPQQPVNPYGRSKLFVEMALRDYTTARDDFTCIALRYFNVAGCAADGTLGEDHQPETHLIPLVLQTALQQRPAITIFGDDYPTPDGTCIRDYVHVEDLIDAHLRALQAPWDGGFHAFNVGIGRGYSVREVIEAARAVTGCEIPINRGPRRPGDPPILYADSTRIRQELGWQPRYVDLPEIIATAWTWFQKHPRGYTPTPLAATSITQPIWFPADERL